MALAGKVTGVILVRQQAGYRLKGGVKALEFNDKALNPRWVIQVLERSTAEDRKSFAEYHRD